MNIKRIIFFLIIAATVIVAAACVMNDQSVEAAAKKDKNKSFYITKINKSVWKRIKGKSYKKDCTIPRKDLRYLHILHKDINGR